MSKWKKFKGRWKDCSLCSLCNERFRIVLYRGTIPCDVLFVGEAPGESEDNLGRPFVGPAGKLLNKQVEEALRSSGKHEVLSTGFTNLVCCIPRVDGRKIGEPEKNCIKACATRLEEQFLICNPRLVVAVGDLSNKWINLLQNKLLTGNRFEELVHITHPAAILRAELVRQNLMDRKVVVALENHFRDL